MYSTKKRILVALLMMCLTTNACLAQDAWYKKVLNKVKVWIDSSAVKGTDPRYIELPAKPWRAVLSSNTNEMNLRLSNYAVVPIEGRMMLLDWDMHVNPPIGTSIGLWTGYRSFGIGYSISLTHTIGINMAFNIANPQYGLGIRFRRFKTDEVIMDASVSVDGISLDNLLDLSHNKTQLNSPISVQSFILDGYWAFNSKRFSIAAANDQSMRQLRSAGSVIAGFTFHQQSIDYSNRLNAELIEMTDGAGRIKFYQLNAGCGYAYNWVPAKGWLFNAMVMPTVSVLNRVKAYYFDSNYSVFADLYGLSEITGKKDYPNLLIENPDKPDHYKINPNYLNEKAEWYNTCWLAPDWTHRTETHYSQIHFNVDARVSATYWWRDYFVNVNGQFNQFRFNHSYNKFRLFDWYVNASIGLIF